MSKITKLLASSKELDRSTSRALRKAAVETMIEMAKEASSTNEQHGIMQNMQQGVINNPTRQESVKQRNVGAKYDTGPKYEKSKVKYEEAPRTLSTRYSPDRPGVQAPLKDGVQIDPLTGKEYNWNDGFTTETGEKFPGGNVSLQSDINFSH